MTEEVYAKLGRLQEKYDLLVKETAKVLEVLDKVRSGELKIEDIEIKAVPKE